MPCLFIIVFTGLAAPANFSSLFSFSKPAHQEIIVFFLNITACKPASTDALESLQLLLFYLRL